MNIHFSYIDTEFSIKEESTHELNPDSESNPSKVKKKKRDTEHDLAENNSEEIVDKVKHKKNKKKKKESENIISDVSNTSVSSGGDKDATEKDSDNSDEVNINLICLMTHSKTIIRYLDFISLRIVLLFFIFSSSIV